MCGLFVGNPKRRLTRDEVNNKFRPENVDDHRANLDDPMVVNDKPDSVTGIEIWNPSPDAKRYPIYMTRDEIWLFRRLLHQEKNTDMACGLRNLKDQIAALHAAADWK